MARSSHIIEKFGNRTKEEEVEFQASVLDSSHSEQGASAASELSISIIAVELSRSRRAGDV